MSFYKLKITQEEKFYLINFSLKKLPKNCNNINAKIDVFITFILLQFL